LNIIGFVMSLPQVGARYMLMSCAYQWQTPNSYKHCWGWCGWYCKTR
jgi:hypothetical protein